MAGESSRYNINVVGQYVDKISKGLGKTTQSVKRFQQNINTIGKAVGNSLAKHKTFNNAWQETGNRIKKNIPVMDKLNFSTKNLTKMNEGSARQQTWVRKQFNMGAQGLVNNATQINKMSGGLRSWGSVMGMTMPAYKRFIVGGGQFATKSAKAAGAIRNFTHGLRGFRMEMLGVMFFGMMLQRTFSQLLKPASNLVGLFELWGIMLEIVFLPIMLLLLPIIIDTVTWFIELSDKTKIAIGIFALFGLVFGTVIFLVGQLTLGIGSLILASALLGISWWALLLVVGIVIAIIVFLVWGFVNIFSGQMEGIGLVLISIGIILMLFAVWWAGIPIAVGLAIYLIIKYWKEFKFFFTQLWLGIKITFKKVIKWIVQAWSDFMKWMSLDPIFGKFFKHLSDSSQEAADSMGDDISDMEALYRRNYVDKFFGLGDWAEEQEEETKGASEGMMDQLGLGMLGSNNILGEGFGDMSDTTINGMGDMTNTIDTGMLENMDLTKMGIDTMGTDWSSGLEGMYGNTTNYVDLINQSLSGLGGGISINPNTGGYFSDINENDPDDFFGPGFPDSGGNDSNDPDDFFGPGYNDFVWRPGSKPTPINPNDTLVGTKSGGGSGITIANTYNVVVSDKEEFERILRTHDQELLSKIERNT